VFDSRVLRRIIVPKRDEIISWEKLHNEELPYLYSSPSIIRMINSKSMRWAGHIARMRVKRNAYKILVGKLEEKDRLCGLVVRVPGYRSRKLRFDSRRYQIF
jgi:hypothetical protein